MTLSVVPPHQSRWYPGRKPRGNRCALRGIPMGTNPQEKNHAQPDHPVHLDARGLRPPPHRMHIHRAQRRHDPDSARSARRVRDASGTPRLQRTGPLRRLRHLPRLCDLPRCGAGRALRAGRRLHRVAGRRRRHHHDGRRRGSSGSRAGHRPFDHQCPGSWGSTSRTWSRPTGGASSSSRRGC